MVHFFIHAVCIYTRTFTKSKFFEFKTKRCLNENNPQYGIHVLPLSQLLKNAQKGRTVSEDELPPIVAVSGAPKPPPARQLSLDNSEFDEFNLNEEELAAMGSSLVDDRSSQSQPVPDASPRQQAMPTAKSTEMISKPALSPRQPAPTKPTPSARQQAPVAPSPRQQAPVAPSPRQQAPVAPSPRQQAPVAPSPRQQAPPKPSPRQPAPPKPSPRQQAPPTKPDGMVDLDAPEFDEFNLSEDDIAAMAAAFVDDRKQDELSVPIETSKPSASLPARITAPPSSDKETIKLLLEERRDQYLAASKGNKGKEREYRVIAAQFGRVLKGLKEGGPLDLSAMPGPPPGYRASYTVDVAQYTPPSNPQADVSSTHPSQQGQSPSSSLPQGQSPSLSLPQGQSPSLSLPQGQSPSSFISPGEQSIYYDQNWFEFST